MKPIGDTQLKVDLKFDSDGDLCFELYSENSYLSRENVVELRDHLNKILDTPAQLSPIIASVDRTDELLEALAKIKDAVVDLKPTDPVKVLSDQLRASLESPDTPEIILGVGDPPEGQDPTKWNFAAVNYAAENSVFVVFEYQKPAMLRDAAFESRRETHTVRPLVGVDTIGPSWSPYQSFTGVNDMGDKTTFRLDRIVGFVKVIMPTTSFKFHSVN